MTDIKLLPHITKPGRYLGSEYNATIKEWNPDMVSFALIFPDLYEIGMSHQGLQILYHILNADRNFVAERCYSPDVDVEKLLIEKNQPLTSLESATALNRFDILAFTLPYELCYTNILTVLQLAPLPLYQSERTEEHPLVIGGGSCSMNPEPVADFFDAILLGDGEQAIVDIGEAVKLGKANGESRNQLLKRLSHIDGVYVPSFFSVSYHQDNTISSIAPIGDQEPKVVRRVLPDLDSIDHLLHPIVPNAKIVHDRLGVEIARGCTRGCRFCQAGIIYRPVRERTPQQIMELARQGIGDSGFDELALLSLSTGDYSCLNTVLPELMDEFSSSFVSVALPSMRVGTLTDEIMEEIKKVRKTGFTLAPEAGSERMRQVINKGISEEDLLQTCEQAFSLGWQLIKLYFMIGLPTETDDDIDEIAKLAGKTRYQGIKGGHGKKQIKVSVGTFVPKPHTPFQWHGQLSLEESKRKIFRIKDNLPKGCTLSYHSPRQSYLEGVFSRGDRRLAKLIEAAWREGARLDAWSDHFDLRRWEGVAEQCGIDLDFYLRPRDLTETLPWEHLDSGVDQRFLRDELDKGVKEIYTPDCRYNDCQGCGLCDFDTVQPIVQLNEKTTVKEKPKKQQQPSSAAEERHIKYMVHYQRRGRICYLGHLEILQLMFRALKRASITTNFSQGYNPSPKISFGPALPVGTESLAEYFIMDLPEPLHTPEETVDKLNEKLPVGLVISRIELHSGKIEQDTINHYTLTLPHAISTEQSELIESFSSCEEYIIERLRKGKVKKIDIRPLVKEIAILDNQSIQMVIVNRAGHPGIKPQEALQHILHLDQETALQSGVLKTAWERA